LIKPHPFLPLSCTFSLLSFNVATILFRIESCTTLGGGGTLKALAVGIARDHHCHFFFFEPTGEDAFDVIAKGARESRRKA
jgi:hypothetical protein